jgi:NADH-quinone oxidoreductase subunit L
MDLIWLIPLLPGLGALINGLVGVRYFSRQVTATIACTAMAGALAVSVYVFFQLLGVDAAHRVHDVVVAAWIPSLPLQLDGGAIGSFQVPWGFRLDPLSAMMLLVVTGIGTLIHVYSTGYMDSEPRGDYARFFTYLNLFCFFMLLLVLGSNFLVMFVGWEGVGLCSYLLIGFYYQKKSASDAGKKAFITNRVGDWGFVLGVFLIFVTFGSVDFREVAAKAALMPVEVQFGVISAICLCLFVGAIGKSAQIPLYVWLPDAMEGPTPVSALIHAATMVTAGVYMVGRNAVLFSHAPNVMMIIAVVGVLTALMAASIGLVQNDIKRVLAYSTVSQLGYMFTAMGVGAFAAGTFHLMTHAFFKALLFLCSGSVIHAMGGEQDMRRMGGLRKYMPITFMTMMIGTLAIAGVPPLSGFFSKDEILLKAFLFNKAIWAVAVVTALMTAFYMYRLMSLTFFGTYRGQAWGKEADHGHDTTVAEPAQADAHGAWHGPHESPRSMTFPLMALAVGAIVAGLVGVPAALKGSNAIEHFLAPVFAPPAVVAMMEPEATGEFAPPPDTAPVHALALHGAPSHATAGHGESHEAEHGGGHGISVAGELGLMVFSVAIGLIGIFAAYRFYVVKPSISEGLARRFSGVHRLLSNKYFVDEAYDSTVIAGTMASGRGLWGFDKAVVDGLVNGAGKVTLITAWFSSLMDRTVVDGLVNLVGRIANEISYLVRRLQTGLIQNYALMMLFGVFVFVTLYLFV